MSPTHLSSWASNAAVSCCITISTIWKRTLRGSGVTCCASSMLIKMPAVDSYPRISLGSILASGLGGGGACGSDSPPAWRRSDPELRSTASAEALPPAGVARPAPASTLPLTARLSRPDVIEPTVSRLAAMRPDDAPSEPLRVEFFGPLPPPAFSSTAGPMRFLFSLISSRSMT